MVSVERTCEACGRAFDAPRARFCGARCRKRAQRGPGAGGVFSNLPSPPLSTDLLARVRADLETAGVLGTTAGQQALLLAARVQTPGVDTGSAVASLSKRLSEAMAEALVPARPPVSPLDELKTRRDRKRIGATMQGGRDAT